MQKQMSQRSKNQKKNKKTKPAVNKAKIRHREHWKTNRRRNYTVLDIPVTCPFWI
jgi:hypothetical protein